MLLRNGLSAVAVAFLLVACGGGDNGRYEKLVSFGDSLSDVGTHKVGTVATLSAAGGGRWTVNSLSGGEIWTERLADALGVGSLCAAETGLQPNLAGITGAPITRVVGCFSYAQGSSRITDPAGPNSIALQAATYNQTTLGLIAKPIANQMAAHLSSSATPYTGKELVTVLAGANDVFMVLNFKGSTDPTGAIADLGTAGTRLGQLIKTEVLARGAKRVLVLNIPNVAGTPFAVAQGAPTAGLIDLMVKEFNTRLATELSGVQGVHLADAYTQSKDTSQYSNSTAVACGSNGLGTTSLVCNSTNVVAGDVSRYQFADDVHPTPWGHKLLADFAAAELRRIGWL